MRPDIVSIPADMTDIRRPKSVKAYSAKLSNGFEVQEFVCLAKAGEVKHRYLEYILETMWIIDEVRRQTGIVFPADLVL